MSTLRVSVHAGREAWAPDGTITRSDDHTSRNAVARPRGVDTGGHHSTRPSAVPAGHILQEGLACRPERTTSDGRLSPDGRVPSAVTIQDAGLRQPGQTVLDDAGGTGLDPVHHFQVVGCRSHDLLETSVAADDVIDD